jgi:hypothetical protein
VNARPQLRRGRFCQLRVLDHQRPRPRLEKMDPPRAQPGATWFAWCVVGALVVGVIALVRGCA